MLANIPNWRLWVIGHVEENDKIKDDTIFYLGYIDDRPKLMSYFKYATASIHLCWFDACPNSVVEAIAQKCPVICNNVGGTRELVGPSGGYVLDLDPPYDYAPIDLYHPNPVDSNLVIAAMRDCAAKMPSIINSHVDIGPVADKYIAFMERFL
jgi:hypothetical protein